MAQRNFFRLSYHLGAVLAFTLFFTMLACADTSTSKLPLPAGTPEKAAPSPENPKVGYEHIQSYEDCVKAGFPQLRSMPPQCVTPDGRRFRGSRPLGALPMLTTPGKPANAVKAATPSPTPLTDKSLPEAPTPKAKKFCKDECGNGVCQELVCMAVGCPCSESADSCPEDCK